MFRKHKETIPQKEISFRRLCLQALPEMWTFQILAGIFLIIPAAPMTRLIGWLAGLDGDVVTTANIKSFLLSWKFPVILMLGFVLVVIYLVFELFGQIYLTDNILNGRRAGVRRCIVKGFHSVKKFMNPTGIGTILFIFIAVPICGVGLSLSLSESFYIPNFIMEVVFKNPLYTAAYLAVIFILIWISFHSLFILHAVLLDGMTPSEGRKYSSRFVKEHRGRFLIGLFLNILVIIIIYLISSDLLNRIPGWILGEATESLPRNYRIDFGEMLMSGEGFSELDLKIMAYRSVAAFAVLVEKYLAYIVTVLCGAYFMLRLNRYYLEYSGRGRDLWPERPRKSRYIWKVLIIFLVFIGFGFLSIVLGLNYNEIFTREEPVKIVAHRTGGSLASENSLQGLEKAIEHSCYGSETDVQRTRDGYYIINHDDDFKRLTGVAKAPKDMTMEEIKELRIRDTTGNGQELPVITIEEMLDVIKGKEKLFVELKGVTADNQMVDDLVRIIREHDCVEDTVLISLNYGVIKYAETAYPEFETGLLFFASLGDVSNLKCDILIMEEETASSDNISNIHEAGKQAMVWTVNTEEGMYHFLDSFADGVITDEIVLAEEVQADLDDRTDLEVLEDKLQFN